MSFNTFLHRFQHMMPMIEEIGRAGAIVYDNEAIRIRNLDQLGPLASKFVKMQAGNVSNLIEMCLLSKVIYEGPKVFEVGQTIELLTHMDVNVEIQDYAQPFETIVLQFPADYIKNRIVRFPQGGTEMFGQVLPETHAPDFMILHHQQNCILVSLVFTSHVSIKSALINLGEETLEDAVDRVFFKLTYEHSLEVSKEEQAIFTELWKAGLNYCLLLDEIGVKKIGPVNPSHYARLQRQGHQAEVRRHPILYALNQEVKLCRVVQSEYDLPVEPTGRVQGPHRRRGHYRMQPCGEGRSKRKRIRIPPTFVNKHLYFGTDGDARVTYT